MSNTPDIIVPITEKSSDPQAWIWIDCISIDRNGNENLVTEYGTEDKWRVSTVTRASLASDNKAILKPDGSEIAIDVPDNYKSKSVDVNKLKHDLRVLQAVALIRSVLIDLHSGALVEQ